MTHPRRLLQEDLLGNLARQFIGFEDFFTEVDKFLVTNNSTGYPPFNVINVAEDEVQIELAIAGFKPEDVTVTVTDGVLLIKGEQTAKEERRYSYRGISARNFERSFRLADYWEVTDASFENGILTVTLRQEIPEARKPKLIQINRK